MAKITSDMNKKNIHFTAKTTNGKKANGNQRNHPTIALGYLKGRIREFT